MAEWRDEARISGVLAVRETELALLCIVHGNEVWVPKSVVSDNSEVWRDGDEGDLVIAQWFAAKKGLT